MPTFRLWAPTAKAVSVNLYADAKYKSVVAVINVDKVARMVLLPELRGRKLQVHKVQRKSDADRLARTTVVFVENAAHED